MKYLALISLFSAVSFASEHSVSFALKYIQVPQALGLFYTHILPDTQTTVAGELINNSISLSFNRESQRILLHGDNEAKLNSLRERIQNHIDRA